AWSQKSKPKIGVLPSVNGLSWFVVVTISKLPLLTTSQAQPEPKRAAALSANSSLNAAKVPHCSLILSTTAPFSSDSAVNNYQNNEWFKCPPPLFLTAV